MIEWDWDLNTLLSSAIHELNGGTKLCSTYGPIHWNFFNINRECAFLLHFLYDVFDDFQQDSNWGTFKDVLS